MNGLIISLLAVTLVSCDQTPTAGRQDVTKPATQKIPNGKVTRYGLYVGNNPGRVKEDPNTSTGKSIRGAVLEFVETAQQIPLRKDVYFGYRYWLKLPAQENRPLLRRVLLHPEMTLPGGSSVSGSDKTIRKRATNGIVTSIDGYALNEDYELVEGTWTFQLWYQDKMLVEQKFTTYWPEQEPEQQD